MPMAVAEAADRIVAAAVAAAVLALEFLVTLTGVTKLMKLTF
jgi:hypothetical protein